MARLTTNVTELIKVGADAMDNMFDVEVTLPTKLQGFKTGLKDQLRFRVEGFQAPNPKVAMYENAYKGVKIKRPATKIEMDRTFNLSFRIDAYYHVYKVLKLWAGLLAHASTGFMSNDYGPGVDSDTSNVFGVVKVAALNSPIQPINESGIDIENGTLSPGAKEGVTTATSIVDLEVDNHILWEFYQVVCTEVKEPAFKHNGGAVMNCQATFQFGEYSDPTTGPAKTW